MIKTIKINKDQSIELNSSMGWLLVYRENFGHDILPDVMPIIESGLSMAIELLQGSTVNINKDGAEIDANEIINNIDSGILSSFFINLSGLETTSIMQIVWAMAKNANDDIPNMIEYYNGFDNFPLDVIMPKVVRAIIDSTVSSKNAKRLLTILKLKAATRSPQTK